MLFPLPSLHLFLLQPSLLIFFILILPVVLSALSLTHTHTMGTGSDSVLVVTGWGCG